MVSTGRVLLVLLILLILLRLSFLVGRNVVVVAAVVELLHHWHLARCWGATFLHQVVLVERLGSRRVRELMRVSFIGLGVGTV